jgi:alpha-ketoglutarate-dependent taurine dioxygenase
MQMRVLDEQHGLPLLIEPDGSDARDVESLAAWYDAHRSSIEPRLRSAGALLFREFVVSDANDFSRFSRAVCPVLLTYSGGNSPRTRIDAGVYTSTEYPAKYAISLHNEMSYAAEWPAKIVFCCLTPAQSGGETPIADCRTILRDMPADIVAAFESKQIRYVRNLHGGKGVGPSWQSTFESSDKEYVEATQRAHYDEFEWTNDGGLRLTNIRPGLASHPITGERVWFNQAEQFHPSALGEGLRSALMTVYGRVENFPQYVTFDDETPIATGMLDRIREVMLRHTVVFPWRQRDVLVLDNVLVSHGRKPFSGPRKILVAMTQ